MPYIVKNKYGFFNFKGFNPDFSKAHRFPFMPLNHIKNLPPEQKVELKVIMNPDTDRESEICVKN